MPGSKDGGGSGGKRRGLRRRLSVAARIRNYFFAGLLISAPIAITIWLAWEIIGFIDNRITPLIPTAWNPNTYLPFSLPGLGLLVMLIGLALIGMTAAGLVGRTAMRTGENLMGRVPVVRSVYSAVKQIFETVLAKKSQAFRQVVLMEYPRRGSWAVGFLTGTTVGEVQRQTTDQVVNVFIPATPNPTTGFLLFVPRDQVYVLKMSVEEGIKLVISGGIVTPADKEAAVPLSEVPEAAEAPPQAAPTRPSFFARMRNYILAGTLVTAPVVITLWLTWNLVGFVDNRVLPLVPPAWNPETYLPFSLPGLGLLVFFIAVTLLGLFAAGFVGGMVRRTVEGWLGQVPVVRSIYATVKQIFETVLAQKSSFRDVALFEYPRKEVWSLGFVTGKAKGEIQERTALSTLNIFLPTTPNPTSGFLLFLPKEDVRVLKMSVEEGLKMVVSGGIVTPVEREVGPPTDGDGGRREPEPVAARAGE